MISGYIDFSKAGSSEIRFPKTGLTRETQEIIEFIEE